ncbi:MAG: hypothetical protein K9L17_12590 [Clostridiales bacterium]|nr:hypothetical protein [Clostridiales bacterium]MCF8023520.1 hypothetical protein [Clostridiales bacterium]
MQAVWDMLSDKRIWSLLGNTEREINEDVARLLFVELFSRLRVVEEENLALRMLLLEEGIIDDELYGVSRDTVRECLLEKDEGDTSESMFFSDTGVPFSQWVNFKIHGKFKEEKEEHNN